MRFPAALLALAGCSIAVMETDPSWTPSTDREPRCDTTKGWAALDGVNGVAWTISALASIAARTNNMSGGAAAVGSQNDTLTVITAVSVLGAIVEFASAGVGTSRAGTCVKQRQERDRLRGDLDRARENDATRGAIDRAAMERYKAEHPAPMPDAGVPDAP